MQTVTHPEQPEQNGKAKGTKGTKHRFRPSDTPTVAFRCPKELKVELNVRVAREQSSVEAVCVAALREYLGKAA